MRRLGQGQALTEDGNAEEVEESRRPSLAAAHATSWRWPKSPLTSSSVSSIDDDGETKLEEVGEEDIELAEMGTSGRDDRVADDAYGLGGRDRREKQPAAWLYRFSNSLRHEKAAWVAFDQTSRELLDRAFNASQKTTETGATLAKQAHSVLLKGPESSEFEVDVAALTCTDLTTGEIGPVQRLCPPIGKWSWGETAKGRNYRSEFGADAASGGGPCWVCKGSGDSQGWLTKYEAIRVEEEKQRKKADEPPPCLVCYDEGKYGLSTECGHFYCMGE